MGDVPCQGWLWVWAAPARISCLLPSPPGQLTGKPLSRHPQGLPQQAGGDPGVCWSFRFAEHAVVVSDILSEKKGKKFCFLLTRLIEGKWGKVYLSAPAGS